MFDYLRRLATTGAAYTASSVLSKLIAVFLLPIYTHYLSPSDYGAAEVMLASVIAASIVVRLGVIEAILRFYYLPNERSPAVVATGFASLFWGATILSLVLLPIAGPISQALLGHEDAGLARLAILGLWAQTLYEYALTLLRLDERAKAYFGITIVNVLITIPFTVFLIVVEGERASGILLGTDATGAAVTVWMLWRERRRLALVPDTPLLRRMFRFGLPTMPAELSLYSLNFIDRIIIARTVGLAEVGLYALAVKFAQAMQVLVRGLQLAWPPLAYSIQDDDEARRVYSSIFTWFAAVLAFAASGLWLESRWIVRLLAAPDFFASYQAVGLLATGIGLYGLYLAMVVILGRTGRTEYSFPATIAAVVTNVILNLVLVPSHGIVGAGLALVGLVRGRPRAHVRVHAASLPGPVRMAPPCPGAAVCRGGGRRRRAVAADLRRDRPAQPRRALARLPRNPLPLRLPPRGGAHRPGRAPTPVRDRRARQGPSRGDG